MSSRSLRGSRGFHMSHSQLYRLMKGLHLTHTLPQICRCYRHFSDWHRLLRYYVALPSFVDIESFELRSPEEICVTAWETVDIVTIFNVFCRPEYSVLSTDTLILDIGANIGAFTLYAAIQAPKAIIVSLEPVSHVYTRLVQQCKQDTLAGRVKTINLAVGRTDGRRPIRLGTNDAVASLYSQPDLYSTDDSTTQEIVDVISARSLIEGFDHEISLLKMDCEGAEWEILDALTEGLARKIRRICLEYHLVGAEHSWQNLWARLHGWGFALRKHVRSHSTGVAWFERQ